MAGGRAVEPLARALRKTGFDAEQYLSLNADLRAAGLSADGALLHYLCYGYREGRRIRVGVFPAGLAELDATFVPNQGYRQELIRGIALAQVTPAQVDDIWD